MDLTLFDTKLSQIKSKNLDQIKTKSTIIKIGKKGDVIYDEQYLF